MDLEHERRLADVEARCKSNTKRLDKMEQQTEAIDKLATSVALMAQKTEDMDGKLETVSEQVQEIKDKPAKRWNTLIEKLLWAAASALLTYALTRLGLGG